MDRCYCLFISIATRKKVEMMRAAASMLPRKLPVTFDCPPRAAAIVNWNFHDAQTGARCAHLHFEIPTISHFPHAQLKKGSAADGAKSRHIRVMHAVKQRIRPPMTIPARI